MFPMKKKEMCSTNKVNQDLYFLKIKNEYFDVDVKD